MKTNPLSKRTTRKKVKLPPGFSRRLVVVRDAHLAELDGLRVRHGITLVTSVDDAIRGYLENRWREAMSNFHGT